MVEAVGAGNWLAPTVPLILLKAGCVQVGAAFLASVLAQLLAAQAPTPEYPLARPASASVPLSPSWMLPEEGLANVSVSPLVAALF
jgi:hypothetical protein